MLQSGYGRRILNDGENPRLLFVMGFGNRPDGATEGWFIDRFTGRGYGVHAIQFITNIAEVHQECVDPVQQVHDGEGPATVLGIVSVDP